ncbi:NAD(P)H-dependent oxidoreductase [Desulfosarcina sp. OttesenSCG-928-A07]|nr:NAD(P)H-dependent oxidoreductase [Desulfosarcina sp. OttesenSCG-928-G17]MDL2329759.1 NAD(P)H-dependent oxidoreductase [Desulfosarcina sp. OttesenSCG-928-A07]
MFILGLQGSPRQGGNTDILLSAFLEKAADAGAATEVIQVARARIAPCKGCGYCETHGQCVIRDDPMATRIFGLLRKADMVVAASPVYFYGVSAQLKGLIDRCQTLWARKYPFKLRDPLAHIREGVLLCVGATKGKHLFDGITLTVRYFFDAIDAGFGEALTFRGIEAKGAIRHQPGLDEEMAAIIEKRVRPRLARKQILFVSPKGACRAPLAAALTARRYGSRLRIAFGAWEPASALSDSMVRMVETEGMDLGYRRPESIQDALRGGRPDRVVVIGDENQGQTPVSGVETLYWPVPVADTVDESEAMRLRQVLSTRVKELESWAASS